MKKGVILLVLLAVVVMFVCPAEYVFGASAVREPALKATIEQRIEGFYNNILGRKSDAAGKAYWVKQAMNGMSFQDIMKNFYNSSEFVKLATKKIEGFYNDLLGRKPDAEGLKYWLGQAKKGMSFSDIRQSFINSPEFKKRIGETATKVSDQKIKIGGYNMVPPGKGDALKR